MRLIDIAAKLETGIPQMDAPTGVLYGYAVTADTKVFHPAVDLVRCCDCDWAMESEKDARERKRKEDSQQ